MQYDEGLAFMVLAKSPLKPKGQPPSPISLKSYLIISSDKIGSNRGRRNKGIKEPSPNDLLLLKGVMVFMNNQLREKQILFWDKFTHLLFEGKEKVYKKKYSL